MIPLLDTRPFLDIYFSMGQRVVLALICGAILGIEREIEGRPAGLRTTMIICLGSMTFSYSSELLYEMSLLIKDQIQSIIDPGRISAQIISGLAFLGSGMLLTRNQHVYGLSSAVLVWVTGIIGLLIGYGHFDWAISFSLFAFLVMKVDLVVDPFFKKTAKLYHADFEIGNEVRVSDLVSKFLHPGMTLKSLKLDHQDTTQILRLTFTVEYRNKETFQRTCRLVQTHDNVRLIQHG